MPGILGGAPPAANAKIFAISQHVIPSEAKRSRGTPWSAARFAPGFLPATAGLGMTAVLASTPTRATFPARERPMAARRSAHLVPHAGLNQRMRSRRSLTKEQFA